jgi:hypothetical protein
VRTVRSTEMRSSRATQEYLDILRVRKVLGIDDIQEAWPEIMIMLREEGATLRKVGSVYI